MQGAMLLAVGLVTLWGGCVLGSAIPMWEYLSRGEKMSHLFNMFSKQVDTYCDTQSMPDCNKVLLVYGMTNLAKMDDDSLDKMDPYQRGATDIVWDSMMKGTYKADRDQNTKTEQEDFYTTGSDALAPSVSNAGNGLGTKGEASSIEEYLSPPPGNAALPNRFLIGPMVIRVMPDGQPIPGDLQRPLPKDEDAEEFKLMRSQPLPSLSELSRRSSTPRRPERFENAPQSSPSGPERYDAAPQSSPSGAERYDSAPQRYENAPQRYENAPQRSQSGAERYDTAPQRYENAPQRSQSGAERYENAPQRSQSGAERYENAPQRSQNVQRPAYALPMQYRTLSV